jgi:hypothetical protein
MGVNEEMVEIVSMDVGARRERYLLASGDLIITVKIRVPQKNEMETTEPTEDLEAFEEAVGDSLTGVAGTVAAFAKENNLKVVMSDEIEITNVEEVILPHTQTPSKTAVSFFTPSSCTFHGYDSVRVVLDHFNKVRRSSELHITLEFMADGQSTIVNIGHDHIDLLKSNEEKTILQFEVPDLSSSIRVATKTLVRITTSSTLASQLAPTFPLLILALEPVVQSFYPSKIGMSGGVANVVLANVANVIEVVDPIKITAVSPGVDPRSSQYLGVASHAYFDGETKVLHIVLELNPFPASIVGQVKLDLVWLSASSQIMQRLPIEFQVFDDTTLFLDSVHPPKVPTSGNTMLQLRLQNWNRTLTTDATATWLRISARFAEIKILLIEHAEGNESSYSASITALMPPLPRSGAVDIEIGTIASDEPLLVVTGVLEVFEVCEFNIFCGSLDLAMNVERVFTRPPLDSICSTDYCMEKLPPPLLRSELPTHVFTGTDKSGTIIVEIQHWPFTRFSSEIEINVGTTIVPPDEITLVDWTGGYARIEFSVPNGPVTHSSKVTALTAFIIRHKVSQAILSFNLLVVNYPRGPPRVSLSSPDSIYSNVYTRILIELSNCPTVKSKDDITVVVESRRISTDEIVLLDSSYDKTIFTFGLGPDRTCAKMTGGCVKSVLISTLGPFQDIRTALPWNITHSAPSPKVRVFPEEGFIDESTVVTVEVSHLIQDEGITNYSCTSYHGLYFETRFFYVATM